MSKFDLSTSCFIETHRLIGIGNCCILFLIRIVYISERTGSKRTSFFNMISAPIVNRSNCAQRPSSFWGITGSQRADFIF
ncbi:hypothetical protein SAMN02910323_0358 [Selenomonas ruminantium]|uniref:Uncharacterized protein n=1 Tax=Selenomonas ruminantium TaxID=971 RepID=A0A1K1LUQ5_SELRU|nr:hypothetical protein SAMN02910323_0358 [Selenomonas ruminantium]